MTLVVVNSRFEIIPLFRVRDSSLLIIGTAIVVRAVMLPPLAFSAVIQCSKDIRAKAH